MERSVIRDCAPPHCAVLHAGYMFELMGGHVALKLILGSKNYSSWSFRPWLAMTVAGIAFEETVLAIYTPGAREKILAYSPSGKVPVLIDDKVRVWESLAIIEYAAEKFPAAGLWPQQSDARAHARAVAHEMHGGFLPLRRNCPMNMRRTPGAIDLPSIGRDNQTANGQGERSHVGPLSPAPKIGVTHQNSDAE